jgi:serine/threonine protein kinase
MLRKNKECAIVFEPKNWAYISPEALALNKMMLESDPTKRITACDALKNNWFEMDHHKETELISIVDKIRHYSAKYMSKK